MAKASALAALPKMNDVVASVTGEIEAIRARISLEKDRIEAVRVAAVSRAERAKRADMIIEAAQMQLRSKGAFESLAAPEDDFSEMRVWNAISGHPHGRGVGVDGIPLQHTSGKSGGADMFGMLATMFPAEVKRMMIDQAEGAASDLGQPEGLSANDRARAIAEAEAELQRLEAAEEQIIRQLETSGFDFARRPDADPAVVLAPDAELSALAPMEV